MSIRLGVPCLGSSLDYSLLSSLLYSLPQHSLLYHRSTIQEEEKFT